jgi:DUF1680 family protein
MKLTWKKGDPNQPHIFWDSDIAKLLEGLCYALGHMNPADNQYQTFFRWVDEGIDMIAEAQAPDGYINIYYSVVEPEKRWTDVAHQHELYCAGHLLEAAIAHYKMTKSSRFLDILCRYIDYICTIFGPGQGQIHGYPGHPEIELALVKLYAIRPQDRYLCLLTYFVEQRGFNGGEFYTQEAINNNIDPLKFIPGIFVPDEADSHWPSPPCHWYMQAENQIRHLKEINGHSVRAMYYLTGVQGLANINKDNSLTLAVYRLWRNMVDKKMYIHGGIGAMSAWEGFSKEYHLPLNCYSETCASIGVVLLARAMLHNHLNGEYARIMEKALYNNVLGGVSLDGTSFFYDQPFECRGLKRSKWFQVSCCPPNVSRLLNSLETYVFTETNGGLSINLYIGGVYENDSMKVAVSTKYPIEGEIVIELNSSREVAWSIVAPSCPYEVSTAAEEKNGYLHFSPRKWNDTVKLSFSIKPEIIRPDSHVESTKGKLAVQRGPFVYGLEQSSSSVPLSDVQLNQQTMFEECEIEIEGATVVGLNINVGGRNATLLPYFTLGNRHPGEDFVVWFDEE